MTRRWRRRENGHVAVASLVTLALSTGFVLWRVDINEHKAELAQCEAAAERSLIAIATFTKITNVIPGDDLIEREIFNYIVRCNPIRDCQVTVAAPPVPEECFAVVPTTTTTTG